MEGEKIMKTIEILKCVAAIAYIKSEDARKTAKEYGKMLGILGQYLFSPKEVKLD